MFYEFIEAEENEKEVLHREAGWAVITLEQLEYLMIQVNICKWDSTVVSLHNGCSSL